MAQLPKTDSVPVEGTGMKYNDPPETSGILEQLKQSKTMGEVDALIRSTFPDWIVTHLPGFSPDYPHLTHNWQQHCDQLGVKRCDVVIVEFLALADEGSEHKLVAQFAECLTMCGFAVRLKENYIPCEQTGLATPTLAMWETMKKMKVVVPEKWSPTVTENSVSVTK